MKPVTPDEFARWFRAQPESRRELEALERQHGISESRGGSPSDAGDRSVAKYVTESRLLI